MKCKCLKYCNPVMSSIVFYEGHIYNYDIENTNVYKVWKNSKDYGVFSRERFKECFLAETPIITPENVMENKEMVNHPSHYNQGNIECIEAMIAAKGIEAVKNFCDCSVFKYEWRLGHKDNETQEIDKMIWYLNKYKELSNESK